MPVSKKRKKKDGRPVGRGEDRLSGLTLQDLINVVAYQDAHIQDDSSKLDFDDPDTKAVIKAVQSTKVEENEDVG